MSLVDAFGDNTKIEAAAVDELERLRKAHRKHLRQQWRGSLDLGKLSSAELAAEFRNAITENGATRAAELWEQIVAGTRPGRFVVLVRNVTADRTWDIDDAAQIVPLEKLNSHHFEVLQGSLKKSGVPPRLAGSFGNPDVALTFKRSLDTFSSDPFNSDDDVMQPLLDLAALLVLCFPCVPHVVAQWWEPADHFFIYDKMAATHGHSGDLVGFANATTMLTAEMVDRYCACLTNWRKLDEPQRSRFRIALQRMSLAGLRQQAVDVAIELGIAMESLLVVEGSGNKEGLGYRIALNAAWLIGTSADDREDLFGVFSYLYDLRSKAVHSGEIIAKADGKQKTPPRFHEKDAGSILTMARELLAHIAAKRIEAPEKMKNIAVRGGQ